MFPPFVGARQRALRGFEVALQGVALVAQLFDPSLKGTPVVASAVGGLVDQVIDGQSGLLVQDPTDLEEFGTAVCRLLDEDDLALGPVVVVSRDMRSHSVPLSQAVKNGLRARGVAVIDIGIADTPQNYFATGFLEASGGIQITASHNPADYNGLKIVREEARPISGDSGLNEIGALAIDCDLQLSEPAGGVTQEDVIEPYLIQQGYITRTAQGRVATARAYRHFGLQMGEKSENDLFGS